MRAAVTFIQVFGRKSDSATPTLQPAVAGLGHLSWSCSPISHMFVSLASFTLLIFVLLDQPFHSDCLSALVLNTTHSHTAVFPLITVADYLPQLGHRQAGEHEHPPPFSLETSSESLTSSSGPPSDRPFATVWSHAVNPVRRKLQPLALTPSPCFCISCAVQRLL